RFYVWALSSSQKPAPHREAALPEPALLIPSDGATSRKKGARVLVSRGTIPLMDFLRFTGDYTGLPAYSGVEPGLLQERQIFMLTDVPKTDRKILEEILSQNGVLLTETAVPGAGRALLVTLR